MQEFDPRPQAARLTPRLLAAGAALGAALFAAKLFIGPQAATAAAPAPSPAAISALQHDAFTRAEALPGFARPELIPLSVLPGETFEAAVSRAGVGRDDARAAV